MELENQQENQQENNQKQQEVFHFQHSELETISPLVAIPLDIQPHLAAVELFHKVHSIDPFGRGGREREVPARESGEKEYFPYSQVEYQLRRGMFNLRQEMVIQSLHSYNLAVIRPDRERTKQRRAKQVFEFESWWLFQTELVYSFSFESCCDYIGVCPKKIRKSLGKVEEMYRVNPKLGLRAVKILVGRETFVDTDSEVPE